MRQDRCSKALIFLLMTAWGSAVQAQAGTALPRETPVENALDPARKTSGSAFGGYGELTLNALAHQSSVVDMRRLVLFFGHDYSERIRFYSEVEVEHAIASSDDAGEVEVEQAFLDGLLGRRFNLRGGLIIMPVGIVNTYHEPPSFNGVDRPDVDVFVIPSTWREPGIGVFGELAEGVRYQAYLVDGFNANGFTAESGVRDGHQEAQLARANDCGGVVRLDYEPILGTVLGASAYAASSGNSLTDAVGKVPVGIFDVDARVRHGGWSARGELAIAFIGDTKELNIALAAGDPEQAEAGPVSSRLHGGYAEIGYDLLRLAAPASSQSLTAFGRFDYTNTQASVPTGFEPRPEFLRRSGTIGLAYRPIPQVALKADYRRHVPGAGSRVDELASAITWLF